MADQSIARKKGSVIIFTIAGFLLFFLVVLLLLPQLVSTRWAGSKVKQAVNDRIPGRVDFQSLSLGWIDGIRCQGLTYDNPEGGVLLKVADIKASKGLFALATNYHDLGEMTLVQPMVYVTLQETVAPTKTDTVQAGQATQPRPADADITDTASLAGLPPVAGKLVISDGGVFLTANKEEKPVLQKLDLQLEVAVPENKLDYVLSFQSGDGAGQVKGKGTAALAGGGKQSLDNVNAQAMLDIENWQVADLLDIISNYANAPTGSGQLNGHLDISGSTGSGLKIAGKLSAGQLSLHGGPLKSDTPHFDAVDVEMDGVKTASGFTVNKLMLSSPLANGTVSGSFASADQMDLTTTMVIDLAETFTQFPGSLSLKKGIRIAAGEIGVSAKATTEKEAVRFSADAHLDALQGSADGRKIAWNEPVTLAVSGAHGATGLKLDNLTVKSSFLHGTGQGDMDHMQIQLGADIDQALKEIEKFIELSGWKGGGKMDLNLVLDGNTPPLRRAIGDITINNFTLQQNGRVLAPPGTFKGHIASDLRLDDAMHLQELLDTAVDVETWAGSGKITMKKFVPSSAATTGARLSDLAVSSTLMLKQVSGLLQTLGTLPHDASLSGTAKLQLTGSIQDNKLSLADSAIDTRDFIFNSDSGKISEKVIHLTARGSADLQQKTVTLSPVELQTSAAQLSLPELLVGNWEQPQNSMKTSGNLRLDLGQLTSQLRDFAALPADTAIAGKGTVKLDIDMTNGQQQRVKLDSGFGPLKVSLPNKPALSEEKVQLTVELKGDIGSQNFAVDKLEVAASPLALSATGKLAPVKNEHQLSFEGSLGLNLQAINGYLKTLTELNVEMTGEAKRPFTIKVHSSDGKWQDIPKNAALTTSFYADSIKAFGVHIQSLDIPVKLADGKGEIDVQGTVNRGKLSVKPAVDFSAAPPVVTIPENSTILSRVGISAEMSTGLLAKMHPVFQGAVVSQGTVDLGMTSFSWPLDEAARKDAAFDSTLTFNEVKLTAGGLLAPLLSVMKVDAQEISLASEPVECIGKDERVQCSDLAIKVKDYTITMAGSIGFDQSLDYSAKIPVTRQMVGGDVYAYLEGASITVPISGTVSKPAISKNIVQTALKDLISQAGKKQLQDQAGKFLQKLFK